MLGVRQQDEGSFASETSPVGGACKCALMWGGVLYFFVFQSLVNVVVGFFLTLLPTSVYVQQIPVCTTLLHIHPL